MIFRHRKAVAALVVLGAATGANATEPQKHRITTHTTVAVCSGGDPCTDSKIPPESYTRLVVENMMAGTASPGANDKRTWFRRFTSSKDIVFEASLATETGRFKDVTPLIYRRYVSARKSGENFTREMTMDDRQYPLFLVTGDPTSQIARFTFDARFESKPSTDAAQMSLGFLSNALKAVSPGSAVVTSLTSESADKVATKVDESFGKFFAESVGEKLRFDVDLYRFKPMVITAFGGAKEEQSLKPNLIIGQWRVSFAPARPSIFSSVECVANQNTGACDPTRKKAAFDDAVTRPNAVLAFALIDKVGNSGTVLSYLKQQDWWASDLGALQGSGEFAAFCRKIRGAMGEIGLSDIDGKIIAYSVSQSGTVTNRVKTGLQNEADCKS